MELGRLSDNLLPLSFPNTPYFTALGRDFVSLGPTGDYL